MGRGSDVQIESMRPGDAERRWELSRQAFGMTDIFDPAAPGLDPRQIVCAYDGDALVGAVVTLDFAMTWGGRAVPCGGVSGVAVAAEARGRGLARSMLAEALRRMAEQGQVVSALYPTTAALYRSMGYEVVGSFTRRRIPLAVIPTAPADKLDWRRVDFGDPAIARVEAEMVAAHDGWFLPDPTWRASHTHRWGRDTKTNRFAYVGGRDGHDVAAVVYHYESSERAMYELDAEIVVGADGDAVAAALGFIAGNGTTATELRTTLPAAVLNRLLPHLQRTSVAWDWPWMVRLVDVPGAIAARGWPTAVSGRVELEITDERRPDNGGAWVLEVQGGEGRLSPGGGGKVAVSVQDLAALYAGGDARAMRAGGRIVGAEGDDVDLLAAAAVSSPTIPYFF